MSCRAYKSLLAIRLVLWVYLSFVALLAVHSCRKSPSGPSISVKEPTYDHGILSDDGLAVSHTFSIRNAGSAPLKIDQIKTSCTCSTSSLPEEAIPPGNTEEIVFTANFAPSFGPQRRSVVVQSNDPARPAISLTIKADVRPDFAISLERLNLGDCLIGQDVQASFEVRIPQNHSVNELSFLPSEPNLSVRRMAERTVESQYGPLTILPCTVQFTACDGIGTIDKSVVIRHQKTGTERKLPVTGRVLAPFRIEPEAISLGIIHDPTPINTVLRIAPRTSEHRVAIVDVTSTSRAIQAKPPKLSVDGSLLPVTIDPEGLTLGLINEEITIVFAGWKRLSVPVPVTGWRR